MNRREALQTIGRVATLGGLGLLAAALGRRSGAAARRESPCTGGGRCGACPALAACALPRGLSARQNPAATIGSRPPPDGGD